MIELFGNTYSLWEILSAYWPVFPLALIVGLIATPLCRAFALHSGIVDMPDDSVKTHKKPTAYLGGVAILLGLLSGLGYGIYLLHCCHTHISHDLLNQMSGFVLDENYNWTMLIAISLGTIVACVVGLIDDIKDIRPYQKLCGQAVAALILVLGGVRPNWQQLLHYVGIDYYSLWLDYLISLPVVLFFILGATNSLNLLDGLDGLCAGVTSVIVCAYLLLALILATWGHSPVGDPIRLILCLALVGGVLGFLPWNRHPAKIFMGDAGSVLLGYVAGTLMILFTERIGKWSVAAIIIFGLPILDTAVALVRRFINHKPLFVSDRGHIYDQLMDRGVPLQRAVHISYLLAGLYACIGLLAGLARFRYAVVMFVLTFAVSAYLVKRWNFLQIPDKN